MNKTKKTVSIIIPIVVLLFVAIIFVLIACSTKTKRDNSFIGDDIVEQLEVDESYQPDYVFDTNNPFSKQYVDRENNNMKSYTNKTKYKFLSFNLSFKFEIGAGIRLGTFNVFSFHYEQCPNIRYAINTYRQNEDYVVTQYIYKNDIEVWRYQYSFGVESHHTTHHYSFNFNKFAGCNVDVYREKDGIATPTENVILNDNVDNIGMYHNLTVYQYDDFIDRPSIDYVTIKSSHGKLIDFDPSGNYTKQLEAQKEFEKKYTAGKKTSKFGMVELTESERRELYGDYNITKRKLVGLKELTESERKEIYKNIKQK